VTEKMLAQQLRQLEADGLVHREAFAEVPPRVEYSLTERGRSLAPHLDRLADWAQVHLADRLTSDPSREPASSPS
jgi:DNA-binding HxlR family transcriptional regulator